MIKMVSIAVLTLFYTLALNTVIIKGAEVGLGEKCDDSNKCVSGAFLECGSDSKCQCLSGLIVSEGQCVLPHNGDCSNPKNGLCDEKSFMKCNPNGKCLCDVDKNKNAWYDKWNKKCVVRDGDTCSVEADDVKCIEGSICTELVTGETKSYACKCNNGQENPETGRCIVYYDDWCGEKYLGICNADKFFTCDLQKGKCKCMNGSWFDPKSEKCVLEAGEKCNRNGRPCAPRSHCSEKTGVCTCDEDFAANKHNQCYIPYGKDCEANLKEWEECDPATYQTCDTTTKKCDCKRTDQMIFEDKTCKIKSSFDCTPNDPTTQQCIENAKCGQLNPNERFRCICEDSFDAGLNHMCYLKYNASCNVGVNGDCNKDKEQSCVGGRCLCISPDYMEVDKEGQCKWKLGSICTVGKIPCADSLVCSKSEGKCICDAEKLLFDNGHGECKKRYGTVCSATTKDPTGLCNTVEYHACIKGTCQCDEDHTAADEGSEMTCVGNLNADCSFDRHCRHDLDLICERGKCVPNSVERFHSNVHVTFLTIVIIFSAKYLVNEYM